MTGNFKQLGAIVAEMFSNKDEAAAAERARAERLQKIGEAKAVITPELLQRIAADEMPENFEITREAYVAIAQLAWRSLQLVQTVVEFQPASGERQH